MQVEASSINLDGVSGRRRENDVENTGIDHSDDGKVKTDRSFAVYATHSISKLRLQFVR